MKKAIKSTPIQRALILIIAPLLISVSSVAQSAHSCVKENITQRMCNLSAKVISKDALCHGTATGTVTVKAKGGSGDYAYSINGGISQSSNVFKNLPVGAYRITVSDAACSLATRTIVLEPEPLSATTTTAPSSSFGYNVGELTVIPKGGTPGYTYSVGTVSHSNNSFRAMAAGAYAVNITDAKGCTISMNGSIPEMTVATLGNATALR